MKSEVFNQDCMEGMREFADDWFDLAVCDPPYGIKDWNKRGSNKLRQKGIDSSKTKTWDIKPKQNYFDELLRVSKSQIIWGANHFINNLTPSKGMIIWDKIQDGMHFNQCEIAWCNNLNESIKIFRLGSWLDKNRFHPTQKPVKLYGWIYKNYLPEGGKVIDTHLGSGSNRIAADKAGNIDFTGYEIDKEYFEKAERRYKDFKSQLRMF